jgi:hypothetical protein
MAGKKDHGSRRRARPAKPTLIFTCDQLLVMKKALRSVIDFASADQLSALWDLETLIGLEISRRYWTKKEIRELRHDVVCESIDKLGWTKGLADAADRLRRHPAAFGSAETMRTAYKEEQRRRPPAQRRPRTWRRRPLG